MYGVITAIFLTSKISKAFKAAVIGVVHFALGCTDLIELKISSSSTFSQFNLLSNCRLIDSHPSFFVEIDSVFEIAFEK